MGHTKGPVVSQEGFKVGTYESSMEIINSNGQLTAINPSGGQDYFVDGSVSASGNGLSWSAAFKTLLEAINASNTNIALTANAAKRSRIFFCGEQTVDLVVFPNKCDVIGVGSFDSNSQACINGNHAPVAPANNGCRFINVWFLGKSAAEPIATLAATTLGLQFINCTLTTSASTKNTSAILATASPGLKVIGCNIVGPFGTSYISFAAGAAGFVEIINNSMVGILASVKGLIVNASTTVTAPAVVAKNVISVHDGLAIDDDADLFRFVDNRIISNTAVGSAAGSGIVDWNAKFAIGNHLVCHDANGPLPLLVPPA